MIFMSKGYTSKEEIVIHGKPTRLTWLLDTVLQWFGPFGTVVDTKLKCSYPGCRGRLVHIYETVEVRGVPHKVVFTKTTNGRRVSAKVMDSCTVPSCPMHGEWTLARIENDKKLSAAYKRKTKAWRYRK
jgi:hypothetical protein